MKTFDDHPEPGHTLFTDEMIDVAVRFWVDHLRHGAIGDEKALDRLPGGRAPVHMLRDLPLEEEKILTLEKRLRHYLRVFQRDTYHCISTGHVWLSVDYNAQGLLEAALKEAGIGTMGRLPFKTRMAIQTILGPQNPDGRSYDSLRAQFPKVMGLITVNGTVIFPQDVFECWRDADSLSVSSPLEAQRMKSVGLKGDDAVPLYAMRGTWDEVMAIHHEIQGWGPYKPFEDEEKA